MQRKLSITDDHGVAGVIAALVTDDVIHATTEEVGRFSLALVAPLGADEHYRWHERRGYRMALPPSGPVRR